MWVFFQTIFERPTSCWWQACGFSLIRETWPNPASRSSMHRRLPDFFTETVFGKIDVGPPRWFSAFLDKLWKSSGYAELINPTLPATGKEGSEWHEVAITHQQGTNETQNYLVRADGWKPIGPPHKLQMNHSHVELKVDVEVPDIRVRFEVDDVRLYLHPAQNPATIVVSSRIANSRPETPLSKLKVRLLEDTSKKLLGEGVTDEGGQARVKLKPDILYPVGAKIEVWGRTSCPLSGIHYSSLRGSRSLPW